MTEINKQIKSACKALALSRLRLIELQRCHPTDHALVLAERRIFAERQTALRATLDDEGWPIDQETLIESMALLEEPKTREEALAALSLCLLYETLVSRAPSE